MVRLNDASPGALNLGVLGQVAAAAATDRATGSSTLSTLLVSKAVAAIGAVSGFARTDLMNTGEAVALSDESRIRVSVDLYAVMLLGAIQAQYGLVISPYASATDPTPMTGDLVRLMANRIDSAPQAGVQELKGWMALLSNVGSGLSGSIPADYASTPYFTTFPYSGSAVTNRNASYPIGSIGQLVQAIGALQAAP